MASAVGMLKPLASSPSCSAGGSLEDPFVATAGAGTAGAKCFALRGGGGNRGASPLVNLGSASFSCKGTGTLMHCVYNRGD
jgi:hypothetical protein